MKSRLLQQKDNPLAFLIGKTIQNIQVEEVDLNGDGENVAQYFTIECTDGSTHVAQCESEVSFQYAHIEIMTHEDFVQMKEERSNLSSDSWAEHAWEMIKNLHLYYLQRFIFASFV